jgi:glycosyltransferase involved in cell wall biosynthesis
MKILMSALACEPGKGSELEVGFQAMLAAARQHDVWVLTNKDTLPAVAQAIEGRPELERIHLEGIDFGVGADGMNLLTIPGFHRYYDRWQRRAATRAIELDRVVDFDVLHHVTLAAYWTRAGVAVLDKPLVVGPVGGGVEPPLPLLRELGWRGFFEDVGRVTTRRFLARFGPARQAVRRADVVFTQNAATLQKIRTCGRVSVLTNGTVVDLGHLRFTGPRTDEVLFVGRLVGWKGPMLALRAFRYVQHAHAQLIFCGDGYERGRLKRAAERWGIADRVHFEGWLPRRVLLSRLATAGALLHPALHEEAGLCVAEALALGTPVVCLDHGGPSEILREWPDTLSEAIAPVTRDVTARRLACAVDRFLEHPPPVPDVHRASVTSFEQELLSAYEVAVRIRPSSRGSSIVWAFPRGKPQLFSDSPRALSNGVLVYAFGRRISPLVQRGIALMVRLPVIRRLVAERRSRIDPVCGWDVWDIIVQQLQQDTNRIVGHWLHLHSQWEKPRSSAIGLDGHGHPEFFLMIEAFHASSRGPLRPVSSFRVPACTASFRVGKWSVRQHELLPRYHRPATWNRERIGQVAADICLALAGALERPADIPSHWRPMHGDLVPWNLREDGRGQLWLMDWEDSGWGPPLADVLRFVVAYQSLAPSTPARIAARVREILGAEPCEAIQEAASFWVRHRNLWPVLNVPELPRQLARDFDRGARERAAFATLAYGAAELNSSQEPASSS